MNKFLTWKFLKNKLLHFHKYSQNTGIIFVCLHTHEIINKIDICHHMPNVDFSCLMKVCDMQRHQYLLKQCRIAININFGNLRINCDLFRKCAWMSNREKNWSLNALMWQHIIKSHIAHSTFTSYFMHSSRLLSEKNSV